MNITLRPATKNDTDFARSVHHRAYRDVVVTQFGDWDENTQDKFFATGWAKPGHEIVMVDNVPCGYVRYEKTPAEIKAYELVLLPEFQGRGIGSALLKMVLAEGAAKNVPIALQVLRENRASKLYSRLGFKDVSQTDTHILMKWTPE
jgi:ribosomal protein S18 acetylase RimI-like enzyme